MALDTTWHRPFLAFLRVRPVISAAARAAGVSLTTVARHREILPLFEEQVQEAIDEGIDRAEERLHEAATDGIEEPVIHNGMLQYVTRPEVDADGKIVHRLVLDERGLPVPLTRRVVSVQAQAAYLKAKRRREYADRQELTGPDGAPMQPIVIVTGVPPSAGQDQSPGPDPA